MTARRMSTPGVYNGFTCLLPTFPYRRLHGHNEISMITKTQIIKAIIIPTLLQQSENWALTGKERHSDSDSDSLFCNNMKTFIQIYSIGPT